MLGANDWIWAPFKDEHTYTFVIYKSMNEDDDDDDDRRRSCHDCKDSYTHLWQMLIVDNLI